MNVKIELIDIIDYAMILVGKKQYELLDLFFSLLPQQTKITIYDINEYEQCLGMFPYSAHLDYAQLEELIKIFKKEGLME